MRRLPVYLLLDCSESMIGPAIEAMQSGVSMLIQELRRDPHALETAFVSVITFDSSARQLVPLTELLEFRAPSLRVRPGTSLGAGLRLLGECIGRECRRRTTEHKGDFKPIVFLLTDGQPTDDWECAVHTLTGSGGARIADIYAVGCGDDVDFDVLARLSDKVLRLDSLTPEKLARLFVWVSASIQAASTPAGFAERGNPAELVDLPKDVTRVEPGTHRRLSGPPRQLFIPARCTGTSRDYLMRYSYEPASDVYIPIASHALATGDGGGPDAPIVSSSKLAGCAPCCHCENPMYGQCRCRKLVCLPLPIPKSTKCPWCGETLHWTEGGPFDVGQSIG